MLKWVSWSVGLTTAVAFICCLAIAKWAPAAMGLQDGYVTLIDARAGNPPLGIKRPLVRVEGRKACKLPAHTGRRQAPLWEGSEVSREKTRIYAG